MQAVTGLDYSYSDMTLAQIDHFINEVKSAGQKPMFNHVYVTGGEPLLHPYIVTIVQRLEQLQAEGYIDVLHINSNLLLSATQELQKYVVNFTSVKDKPSIHDVVLLHPSEFGVKKTYAECTHCRKHTWVLNYLGFSLCCAGDAYVRLFGKEHLILDHLPRSVDEFPNMDEICAHCPFSNDDRMPKERDRGSPVSIIYSQEAEKNKVVRLTRRYPEC
jgi:hypothetical protein